MNDPYVVMGKEVREVYNFMYNILNSLECGTPLSEEQKNFHDQYMTDIPSLSVLTAGSALPSSIILRYDEDLDEEVWINAYTGRRVR